MTKNREEFVYDDVDGSFSLAVDEESIEFKYFSNGDLTTLSLTHCPHNLEDFVEFLLAAGRGCQAELGRQELAQYDYSSRRL